MVSFATICCSGCVGGIVGYFAFLLQKTPPTKRSATATSQSESAADEKQHEQSIDGEQDSACEFVARQVREGEDEESLSAQMQVALAHDEAFYRQGIAASRGELREVLSLCKEVEDLEMQRECIFRQELSAVRSEFEQQVLARNELENQMLVCQRVHDETRELRDELREVSTLCKDLQGLEMEREHTFRQELSVAESQPEKEGEHALRLSALQHEFQEQEVVCTRSRAASIHQEESCREELVAERQELREVLAVLCKEVGGVEMQRERAFKQEILAFQDRVEEQEGLCIAAKARLAHQEGLFGQELMAMRCELQEEEHACRLAEEGVLQYEQTSRDAMSLAQEATLQHEHTSRQVVASVQSEESLRQELKIIRLHVEEEEESLRRVEDATLKHEQSSIHELALARSRHEEQLKKQADESASALASVQSRYEEQLNKENEQSARTIALAESRHEEQLNKEVEQSACAIALAESRHEEQLNKEVEQSGRALASAHSRYQEQLYTEAEETTAQNLQVYKQSLADHQEFSERVRASLLDELKDFRGRCTELEEHHAHTQDTIMPMVASLEDEVALMHEKIADANALSEESRAHTQANIIPMVASLEEEVALMHKELAEANAQSEESLVHAAIVQVNEETAVRELAMWRQYCEEAYSEIQQMPESGDLLRAEEAASTMRDQFYELSKERDLFREEAFAARHTASAAQQERLKHERDEATYRVQHLSGLLVERESQLHRISALMRGVKCGRTSHESSLALL